MTNARHSCQDDLTIRSRVWFAAPLLTAVAIGVVCLASGLGLPQAVAATPAAAFTVPSVQSVIVASPQPGDGEAALDPYQLPQSY